MMPDEPNPVGNPVFRVTRRTSSTTGSTWRTTFAMNSTCRAANRGRSKCERSGSGISIGSKGCGGPDGDAFDNRRGQLP